MLATINVAPQLSGTVSSECAASVCGWTSKEATIAINDTNNSEILVDELLDLQAAISLVTSRQINARGDTVSASTIAASYDLSGPSCSSITLKTYSIRHDPVYFSEICLAS
jgi:hypothetical protein